jgi:hypothetical protein
MRTLHALAAVTVAAVTALVGCGANPDGAQPTSTSSEAVTASKGGGVGSSCQTDSTCERGLVCEPICPVIPDHVHCDIAGGTCEASCTRSASSLDGQTFTSADGAHSITFTSARAYTKTDGCPDTGGITCEHIAISNGTFTSNGTTVDLVSTLGARDTLTVEAHCYEGLLDHGDNVDLYATN